MKIIILGAGIAGISAAYHAKIEGYSNVKVFEQSNRVGGLLDNFEINGFRFDYAVHLSFTKDKYVKTLLEQTPTIKHTPEPYNYDAGRWIKHPVQNNLFPLKIEEKVEAIRSFINKPSFNGGNYKDWLISQYGEYIAEKFPIKYTRKYWVTDAENLSVDWVANRFSTLDLTKILEGSMTDQTPNYYYANEMLYPEKGGYKSFIQPLIEKVKNDIYFNKKVVVVNEKEKWVKFDDGSIEEYDILISSIPLPYLTKITSNASLELKEMANSLKATSVGLVSLGFNKPNIAKHLWFYIYDEDILAARVYSPSFKSFDNVPPGCSSLQFEIYFSKESGPRDEQKIISEIIISLEKMGIANAEDIVVADYREIDFGNVIFYEGMVEKREQIKHYFHNNDIHLVGRFGEWDYLWSDQSLMSGRNSIVKIKGDKNESINRDANL